MKRGQAKVSLEIFGDILDLPEGLEVQGVIQDVEDRRHGQMTALLSGELLPDRQEGSVATPVELEYEGGMTDYRLTEVRVWDPDGEGQVIWEAGDDGRG